MNETKNTVSIELTEQEAQLLAEFAAKQYEGAGDGGDWMCEDNEYTLYPNFDAMLEDLRKEGKELPAYEDVAYEDVNDVWISSEEDYCEAYGIHARSGQIIDTYRPVAFFLIRDEALRYRDGYQAHNCENCRIYTYGLGYSNDGDLPVFRELLMKMGRQLAQEGGRT